jgi:hypothetical protein
MMYLQLIILLVMLLIGAAFFALQQQVLKKIKIENRTMPHSYVWLQLIPLFGLYWQFKVVTAISSSINNELTSRIDDNAILTNHFDFDTQQKPTYNAGIACCILVCGTMLPFQAIKLYLIIPALGAWIWYIVQLFRFQRRL